MMTFNQLFKAARLRGVPLLGVETPDPTSTIKTTMADMRNGTACLQWDMVRGLQPLNKEGAARCAELAAALGGGQEGEQALRQMTTNPTECCSLFIQQQAGKDGSVASLSRFRQTVIYMHNAASILNNDAFLQALWNLRDPFKAVGCVVVILGPSIRLPAVLQNDVIVLTHPYPNEAELRSIVDSIATQPGIEIVDDALLRRSANELRGCSSFAAEQVFAMSLGGKPVTVDLEALEARKNRQIEETRGLSVVTENVNIKDVMNCDNVIQYLTGIMSGPLNVRVIVIHDEIEKAFAGLNTESSGTTMDALMVLLKAMQNRGHKGCIFNGVPGSGKTMSAKAVGQANKVKVVDFDMGAMKGGLVGESEANIRQAIAKIEAIAGEGGVFHIATCNNDAVLPPELKRRFSFGTFFFDCSNNKAERMKLWNLYRKKFKLESEAEGFDDDGWTGAEIRACCETAWAMGKSLAEASKFITPVWKQARKIIESGRKKAMDSGYVSASYPGPYVCPTVGKAEGRQVEIEG